MWDDQAPALRESFRLLRYDQRGHGGLPVPSGPYKIRRPRADALAPLDRLEIESTSFCGLSIGGLVGMWLASEASERVERLVPCCTAARFDPEMYDARASKHLGLRVSVLLPMWCSSAGSRPSSAPPVRRPWIRQGTCCVALRWRDTRVVARL